MFFIERQFILFIYVVGLFVFSYFIKYLQYADLICYDCEEADKSESLFDYIVVGCGSAGSIVAQRLAENKNNKILLLEAGYYGNGLLDIPPFSVLLHKTWFDWQYTTVPQQNSCFSLNNNSSVWPMGKIIGGTSMLNNMIYVRGHQLDFDSWFKGLKDYSYNDYVMPYFKKLEKWNNKNMYGSIYINDLPFSTNLSNYIINAAKELKFPITNHTENCDYGFGTPKINSKNGQRWTTAHTLLTKNYPNLILRTQRIAEKVLFHNNFEAYGIMYKYLNKSYFARAKKGVILSAGVVGSAKILLNSGIGPKDHLNKVGIKVKQDLPVGENLQDHLTTGFDLILLKESLGIGIKQMLSPFSAISYLLNGNGPWTTIGCEVLAHLNTEQNQQDVPNIQLMVMNLGLNEDNGIHFRKLVGINDDIWFNYFSKLNDSVTVTILPVLLHPKSKGTIRLNIKNPNQVVINPNYLSHQSDVDTLVKGIEIVQKLVNTDVMKKAGASFNLNNFPPCIKYKFGSKKYWSCYIRHITITSYHPIGSCKMANSDDQSGVVDFNFMVKRTNKLFVVDGSVLPTLTSGNISGAILMLAEMASDIIKNIYYNARNKSHLIEVFIPNRTCLI